jgi:L-iduronidase
MDWRDSEREFHKFWNSTGFTPATLMLTRDMQQQIIYFGSIPRGGLHFVRVHFLLELVGVTFDEAGATAYQWSRLDQALDCLVANRMAPVFELMGNPNGLFTSFREEPQLQRWQMLIHDLAIHLMDRYGKTRVETWYFETWNEPDAGWWHEFPQDEAAFCNYYDACVYGLKRANPNLIIGGPGTCRTLSPLFKSFLAHCDYGIEYFTGRTGVALDFISIHEKAAPARKEDIVPRTAAMVDREIEILKFIRQNHPRFANLPFMNNECDPQVGWKDFHTWHARSYYATWIVKSVFQHQTRMIDELSCNYVLLSNDHGFIGEWGNRTLMARFGASQWIEDGQSGHQSTQAWKQVDFSTPDFTLVKKPAFSAQTLLSLLGNRRLPVKKITELKYVEDDAELNTIATLDGEAIALVVYFSRDNFYSSGLQSVRLIIENLPHPKVDIIHYRIDDSHNNPFSLWEAAGAPKFPDTHLIAKMRHDQEPSVLTSIQSRRVVHKRLLLTFNLPLHAVSLIYITPSKRELPPMIKNITLHTFPGLDGQTEHLLSWENPSSEEVLLHEILYSQTDKGSFASLNYPNLLTTACMLDKPGYYRIRSKYISGEWGKPSPIIPIKG